MAVIAAAPAAMNSLVDQTLSRAQLEALIAAATAPLVFDRCDLAGADLRRLPFRKMQLNQIDFSEADLSGCDFRDAVFLGGSLRNAHLKLTRFEGADLREADISGLKLVDAKLFRGATISLNQAAGLLAEMGITVA